jgi:hypothetical protein
VLPLPGPLEEDPTGEVYELAGPDAHNPRTNRPLELSRTMLRTALVDVERGAYDERIIAWLAGWDVSTIATVASLFCRCYEAGSAAGRAERSEERPTVKRLRANIARLVDDLGTLQREAREAEADRAWKAEEAASLQLALDDVRDRNEALRRQLGAVLALVATYASQAEIGAQPTGRELLAEVDAEIRGAR